MVAVYLYCDCYTNHLCKFRRQPQKLGWSGNGLRTPGKISPGDPTSFITLAGHIRAARHNRASGF